MRSFWLSLGFVISLGAQQGIGPDEMRFRGGPYLPPSTASLRTEVKLVEVPVVVRDNNHRAVAGLTQKDFEILDMGKKRPITVFSVETSAPATAAIAPAGPPPEKPSIAESPRPPAAQADRTPRRFIALCFDDLNVDAPALKNVKAAAVRFVKETLVPGDRVGVFATGWKQPPEFTDEVPKLLDSIEKLQTNQRLSQETAFQCPPISAYEAYLITNNLDSSLLQAKIQEAQQCPDARGRSNLEDYVKSRARILWERTRQNSEYTLHSIQDVVDVLAKMPGRRVVLLMSSGFLSGNLEDQEDTLISRARHVGVVINSLQAKGLEAYTPGRQVDEATPVERASRRAQILELTMQGRQMETKDDALAVLAMGTGGSFFHNNNDVNTGLRQLGAAPEVLYILGFTPSDVAADGRFHNLKVRLTGKNHYSLQARLGYVAPVKTAPEPLIAPTKLDRQVTATETMTDVPVSISIEHAKQMLTVVVHIDVERLRFEMKNNRKAQKLTFIAALLDTQGNFVTGKQGEIELALKEATFTRLVAEQGFNATFSLEAPPGAYCLRGLVEEGLEGKMTASSQAVEIR